MRKRVRIALAVLLVALLGTVAWQILSPSEPCYQGKRLSYWLAAIHPVNPNAAEGKTAEEAVHHIGTNGIPIFLAMLREKDSPLKSKIIDLVNQQHVVPVRMVRAGDKNERAWIAFGQLGATAEDAVPALVEIYEQNISEYSQAYTARSLGSIGPAASRAAPWLIPGLTNSSIHVRYGVMAALTQIDGDPKLIVRAMEQALDDHDGIIRCIALSQLEGFGEKAKQAAPALVQLLNDRDPGIRPFVTNALKAIDPEAALAAGIK